MENRVIAHSIFSEFDVYLFRSGNHLQLYNKFGSHRLEVDGKQGMYFAVYAPAASSVQVVGDFNFWGGEEHNLYVRWDGSGIWEGFIPDIDNGVLYKYKIRSHHDDKIREKADPYAFFFEMPPRTSSITWDLSYEWKDKKWMKARPKQDLYDGAMSIYELHLGSWRKNHDTGHSLSYKELADELVAYVKEMGYTHIELLPITEHPFYPSWGYLSTGYFAPTSRFGDPQDFMFLVDKLHQANIGIILDWVPAHFPSDDAFLADFDGSNVYEHPDPKKGFHPDWNSYIFNFERPEIRSFLLSSAHFWLEKYHIDGLRVDAVASMLYLDYSREDGDWEANEYGGNHNLAAISFIKDLNQSCYEHHPGITIIAEESTAFGGVTQPVSEGGLGFGFKWMMGWMNDTLEYMKRDPIYRQYHHNEISFSMAYAYSETYVLPLSHDEVVHGKNSLIYKMPGDEWQRFANLRLLYGYMFTHPGHKLLFMGNDIAQTAEWNVNNEISWNLLEYDPHKGVQHLVKDLNALLKKESAMSSRDFELDGYEWIDYSDHTNSILSYIRKDDKGTLIVCCNFTPATHENYRIGVPAEGKYVEVLNTDDQKYWGSHNLNDKPIPTEKIESHGRSQSITLRIPPLGVTILKLKSK